MFEGNGFFDIILLAMVAAFIILRLRSVLGRRGGHEQQPPDFLRDASEEQDGNVVHLPDRSRNEDEVRAEIEGMEDGIAAGLTQIRAADRSFSPQTFTSGARAAYEMIVEAFAGGDRKTLKPLLSDDVMRNFDQVLKHREETGEVLEQSLVSLNSADIIEAELEGKLAKVTVKFVSEMISVTRDAAGEVIAGDPTAVQKITDIWTFVRNTRSSNPNWALAATRAPN